MILGVLDDLLDRPRGQKLGIMGGAVVLVALLDWNVWYGPKAAELNDLRTQVADRRAELDRKQQAADGREAAEREVRDLQAELRRAQARLPDEREIADLLSNIATSGRASGLEITLFRQKPEVFAKFYAEVPVQMEMRGTFHDVANFLDRVKRLDRIVNVIDLQFRKPQVVGEQVQLDVGCTVTTFRFLDEAERRRLEQQQKKGGNKKGDGQEDA